METKNHSKIFIGGWYKTTHTIYAGLQKDQVSGLNMFPPGTVGQIKASAREGEYNINYYYFKIKAPKPHSNLDSENKKPYFYFWAKISPYSIEGI